MNNVFFVATHLEGGGEIRMGYLLIVAPDETTALAIAREDAPREPGQRLRLGRPIAIPELTEILVQARIIARTMSLGEPIIVTGSE